MGPSDTCPASRPSASATPATRLRRSALRHPVVRLLACAMMTTVVVNGEAVGMLPGGSILALRAGGEAAPVMSRTRGRAGALFGALCKTEGDREECEGGLGSGPLRLRGGAKSKNHTNHNQSKKAHRNGIKRAKTHRYESMKDRDIKTWRNMHYARAGSMKLHKRKLEKIKGLKAQREKERKQLPEDPREAVSLQFERDIQMAYDSTEEESHLKNKKKESASSDDQCTCKWSDAAQGFVERKC